MYGLVDKIKKSKHSKTLLKIYIAWCIVADATLLGVAKKKKEEALKITEAIDTIAGTCIQLHTRLENLERVIQQMAEDMGYEVQFKIDKEKLN